VNAKKYWVEIPVGMHLGSSRDSEGSRGLLFDDKTNTLQGHADLFEVEEDDDYEYSSGNDESEDRPLTEEELEQAILGIVVLVTITAMAIYAFNTKALPRIRAWWASSVVPRLERFKKRLRSASDEPDHEVALGIVKERVNVSGINTVEFSRELDVALHEYRDRMTGAEAHERLRAIEFAEAFIAEQRQAIANADFDLRDYFAEINNHVERFAQRPLPATSQRMLSGTPLVQAEMLVASPRAGDQQRR
jgi:hypothetical protein